MFGVEIDGERTCNLPVYSAEGRIHLARYRESAPATRVACSKWVPEAPLLGQDLKRAPHLELRMPVERVPIGAPATKTQGRVRICCRPLTEALGEKFLRGLNLLRGFDEVYVKRSRRLLLRTKVFGQPRDCDVDRALYIQHVAGCPACSNQVLVHFLAEVEMLAVLPLHRQRTHRILPDLLAYRAKRLRTHDGQALGLNREVEK